MMNLSKNIVNRRKFLNLTQEQLAESSDITVNYLSKLERNHIKDIKLSTLKRLSKSLNLSIDTLINGEDVQNYRGPYQQKLESILNQYDIEKAEKTSKNILNLLKTQLPDE